MEKWQFWIIHDDFFHNRVSFSVFQLAWYGGINGLDSVIRWHMRYAYIHIHTSTVHRDQLVQNIHTHTRAQTHTHTYSKRRKNQIYKCQKHQCVARVQPYCRIVRAQDMRIKQFYSPISCSAFFVRFFFFFFFSAILLSLALWCCSFFATDMYMFLNRLLTNTLCTNTIKTFGTHTHSIAPFNVIFGPSKLLLVRFRCRSY